MLLSLAGFAARRARAVLAVALAVTAAGLVAGGSVAGRLTSGGFHDASSGSWRAQSELVRATGSDPGANLLVVVALSGGPRSPGPRQEVRRVVGVLRARFGLARVAAPFSPGAGRLLSRDGRLGLVIAQGVSDGQAKAIAAVFAGDRRVAVGGGPVVSEQVSGIIAADLTRAELIAVPLLLLLSFWIFRGLVAALLPPLVGLVTVAGALLGLRAASELTSLSVYALNLVTGLGLGLAIDWSLFVVSRYREELARSGPGAEALARTLATAGRTVLFSAGTVAAALASLLVFPQGFLFSMGIGGILVALIGAAAALVFLPAVLFLLGARVNSLAPRRLRRVAEAEARPASSGFWYRLSRLVMRHPASLAAATMGVLLVLGAPFLGIRFTGFSASILPKGASGRQVDTLVRTRFEPALNPAVYIVARAPASARRELTAYAARLRALPERPELEPPQLVGSSTWQIAVGAGAGVNAATSQRLVRAIRSLKAPFPVLVGGDTASLVDQKASLAAHLPYALAIVVATTLAILFLLTGSLLLPLKAVVLNLLTISAVFGVLVWIFQDGRLQGLLGYTSQGGIDTTQPVLVAVLAFALSTDYGIFLLTRIKEAHDNGADDATAVAIGLERTGRIVTAAALLFLVAIGVFAASRIITIKEVGLGTGLAVAIDATIVRALLVPSLMCLLGRRNWWAPRPLRRIYERSRLSEATR